MSGKEDTAKLYTLDEDALGDTDDTDSLPTLPDAREESDREAERVSQHPGAANVDGLDWLISITTAIDKRIERIEEELRHIKLLLSEDQEADDKAVRGNAFAALVADIRRRFK